MIRKTRELIKDLEEQLEALVIAIPKEEAAHHFYVGLAESTRHEGACKMFRNLAEQELEHRHSLEKVVEDIKREIARLRSEERH